MITLPMDSGILVLDRELLPGSTPYLPEPGNRVQTRRSFRLSAMTSRRKSHVRHAACRAYSLQENLPHVE
jgi:hypothetical protein